MEQPFDSVSTGSSEDADLVPVQSGEDWIARLDDDLSRPVETSGDSFHISALQKEDPVCMTLHAWVVADEFPAWAKVKSMLPELRSLWHHRNKGWQRTTFPVLSCIFIRRSFGTDADAGEVGRSFLLVGDGG